MDMVARIVKRQGRGPSIVTYIASLHYATIDRDVDLKTVQTGSGIEHVRVGETKRRAGPDSKKEVWQAS